MEEETRGGFRCGRDSAASDSQTNRVLAHSVEGTAYQIRYLLSHPDIARRLGEQGHEHVRENFLITGNVRRYLTLFLHLTRAEGRLS